MRRTTLLLLLLIGLSFALRVYLLGYQELRGDEGFSWNYIQDTPFGILGRIIREGDPQPPLHYWLLWSWVRLNGDSEFALRFPSAFLSVLLVPLVYQVGRKLWSKEAGLLAAFITAVHPQQIWLAQDARSMYPLALVAILTSTWLLPDLLRRGGVKLWLGYTACGLLALFSHYYAIFPLIAQGALVLEARPARRPAWRWISACATMVALGIPWGLTILPVYAQGQLSNPGNLTLAKFTSAVFGELSAGPAFPSTTQIMIAFAVGIVALIPFFARVPWKLYLAVSIVVPFAGIYAVVGLRSTFNAYYFIFAFPAAYFLVANGLLIIYRKSRLIGAGLLVLLVVVCALGLYNQYFDPRYSKTRGLREAALYLSQTIQPGDGFLANFPDPVQGYYLRHLNLPYTMLPATPNFTPTEVNTALDRLNYRRTWFIPIQSSQWDNEGYVLSHLTHTALLFDDQHFDKTRLMLFTPPDQATPLDAQFADGISLVGYAVAPNRLTLVWRATGTPSVDYTIFVHALARDGILVAQHDAPPALPTSRWQAGQIFIDTHELELQPDQPLIITAGMYQPDTGERLKLRSAASLEPNAAMIFATQPK